MEIENKKTTISLQIETPSGMMPFDGVARYWHDNGIRFTFEDETTLDTAKDHRFIVDGNTVFSHEVVVGDDIGKIVKSIEIADGQYFYDPVNVGGGRVYKHDGCFLSHNTFFGTGNTLISPETLLRLKARNPKRIRENGSLFIYEDPKEGHDYIFTVDVAKGRGQDYSTITAIDISEEPFKQVAVYRNNIISPLLFPTIIYKYASLYNNAHVVIENNDQGSLVCHGLFHDLEYEHIHMSSSVKSDSLGVMMNRKTKRLGCTGFKNVLESGKLEIVDENSILEIASFIQRRQSWEAADGNHDDLVMNLVMFGYFITSRFFEELTDINIKKFMYNQRMAEIIADVPEFGIITDGNDHIQMPTPEDPWSITGPKLEFQDWD